MITLDISGYIGGWGYSRNYVKNFLKENKGKSVTINVSSLGGEFAHALGIDNDIAEHGDVTINYTAFNASSATLLSVNAKHIKAASNSFYLIHKVMSWIDEWGFMNEDDLDNVITKLEKEKKENEKMTLVLARMYANKSGKSIQDILNLMKEETWLTAQEAKDWGFIDEVYEPAKNVNHLENKVAMALMNANGMPIPMRKHEQPNNDSQNSDDSENRLVDKITSAIGKIFNQKSNTKLKRDMTKQKLAAICTLLAVASIEMDEEKGAYMSEEWLNAIDGKLNKFTEIETQLSAVNQAKEKAEADLTAANATIAERDATITAQVAEIAVLKDEPGTNGAQATTSGDDKPKVKTNTVAKGESIGEDILAVTNEYLGE